jgi:hypothetical protein
VQHAKQELGIVSIDEGIQIDSSDEHPKNVDSPRIRTREPVSKVTITIVPQKQKHPHSIRSVRFEISTVSLQPKYRIADTSSKLIRQSRKTFRNALSRSSTILSVAPVASEKRFNRSSRGGRQINFSDQQRQNADSPITESLLPFSNVTLERLLQFAKHPFEIASIDEGIQIEFSNEQRRNADLPRIKTRLPLSKVTVERLEHWIKHESPIISIEEGIQIDSSEKHIENADSQRRVILQSVSKTTFLIVSQPQKHPDSTRSIGFEI